MKSFDFISTIRINAETEQEAEMLFKMNTMGMDITVSEIEVQEWSK